MTQSQIWQALLHEAKERELGMVIVSHSESLLKRICTRQIDLKALQEKMAAVHPVHILTEKIGIDRAHKSEGCFLSKGQEDGR